MTRGIRTAGGVAGDDVRRRGGGWSGAVGRGGGVVCSRKLLVELLGFHRREADKDRLC